MFTRIFIYHIISYHIISYLIISYKRGSNLKKKRILLSISIFKDFHFCYYSIRFMDESWTLERNFDTNNKAVIRNCMKTTSYTYGFTYQVDLADETYMYVLYKNLFKLIKI